MMIRPEVEMLADLGPLGDEDSCSQGELEIIEAAIDRIERPLTLDEARVLLPMLDRESQDSLYGMVWTILHLLESAPGWPPEELNSYPHEARPWFETLRRRLSNELSCETRTR